MDPRWLHVNGLGDCGSRRFGYWLIFPSVTKLLFYSPAAFPLLDGHKMALGRLCNVGPQALCYQGSPADLIHLKVSEWGKGIQTAVHVFFFTLLQYVIKQNYFDLGEGGEGGIPFWVVENQHPSILRE